MADPLDGPGHECFIHIICIILKTKKVKEKDLVRGWDGRQTINSRSRACQLSTVTKFRRRRVLVTFTWVLSSARTINRV